MIRKVIDESHPAVQKLLDADYGLEESIEAVEMFQDDVVKAMDYLDTKDDAEEEDESQTSGHEPLAEKHTSIPGPVVAR